MSKRRVELPDLSRRVVPLSELTPQRLAETSFTRPPVLATSPTPVATPVSEESATSSSDVLTTLPAPVATPVSEESVPDVSGVLAASSNEMPTAPVSQAPVVAGEGDKDAWKFARRALEGSAVIIVAITAALFLPSLSALASCVAETNVLAGLIIAQCCAAAVLIVRSVPTKGEPPIADRQVDLLVAATFLGGSVVAMLGSSRDLTWWQNRIDLVGLALFVAGAAVAVLGVRILRRAIFAWVLLACGVVPVARFVVEPVLRFPRFFDDLVIEVAKWFSVGVSTKQRSSLGDGSNVAAAVLVGALVLATGCHLLRLKKSSVVVMFFGVMAVMFGETLRTVFLLKHDERVGFLDVSGLLLAVGLSLLVVFIASKVAKSRVQLPVYPPRFGTTTIVHLGRTLLVVGLVGFVSSTSIGPIRPFETLVSGLGTPHISAFAHGASLDGFVPYHFERSGPVFTPGGDNWRRFLHDGDALDIVEATSARQLRLGDLAVWYPVATRSVLHHQELELGDGVFGDVVKFISPNGASFVAVTWAWPVKAGAGWSFERWTLVPEELSGAGAGAGVQAVEGDTSVLEKELVAQASVLVEELLGGER